MRLQANSLHTSWGALLLQALLINPTVLAKKDEPTVVSKSFDHAPVNLQYFDDSDVVMFQDWTANSVWRSTDAGVTWNTLTGGPEAGKEWNMYMHPHDSKRGYVLSEGVRHWMTDDRGETWKEFQTEAGPSSWRPAIQFHAGDPDRIIFNGQDCTGLLCEEMVSRIDKDCADCEGKANYFARSSQCTRQMVLDLATPII